MKKFKYIFVFFLLTLNLRLYSSVVNNYFINIQQNNAVNNFDNVFIEDKYDKDNKIFWKKEASKTDDTYSFWYWLSNVSVLGTGGLCFFSYFLFPEWFLLLATILGLLYVIHFFLQITSPSAFCLFIFESEENFKRYISQNKPKIESVVTYEHEYTEKNSKGEEKTKKELIKTIRNDVNIDFNIGLKYNENQNMMDISSNKPLTKYKINLFIHKSGGDYPAILDLLLTEAFRKQTKDFKPCCNTKKHRIKRNVYWNVPNIGNYMLISNGTSLKPWHVSFWWFLLFTILPFSQLYKLWVNRYCKEGVVAITYTITNYDLYHLFL